jgi:hypothetical protein
MTVKNSVVEMDNQERSGIFLSGSRLRTKFFVELNGWG